VVRQQPLDLGALASMHLQSLAARICPGVPSRVCLHCHYETFSAPLTVSYWRVSVYHIDIFHADLSRTLLTMASEAGSTIQRTWWITTSHTTASIYNILVTQTRSGRSVSSPFLHYYRIVFTYTRCYRVKLRITAFSIYCIIF